MPFIRPDVKVFLDLLAVQPRMPIQDLDPATARQQYRTLAQFAELPRGPIARVETLSIPSPRGHDVPARLYSLDEASGSPAPTLVYMHGGGWVIGDLETHDSLCSEISRTLQMTVVSIDYRRAPEHPFPAGIDDCLVATRWIAGSPAVIGHAVNGIVLAGDSAGGNYAAGCAQALTGKLPAPILAQWLIYPSTDLSATRGSMQEFAEGYILSAEGVAWFIAHYLSTDPQPLDPRASPLHGNDFAILPPTLVFTCSLDPLRDQGRAYAAKLIEHGIPTRFREAKGQVHGCLSLRKAIPSAQDDLIGCLTDLKAIINEAIAEQPDLSCGMTATIIDGRS